MVMISKSCVLSETFLVRVCLYPGLQIAGKENSKIALCTITGIYGILYTVLLLVLSCSPHFKCYVS